MFHLDYETFSEADLPNCGSFRYAYDPSTEILCAAIARDDGEPVIWVNPIHRYPGSPHNPDSEALFIELTKSDEPVYAHNVLFELPITEALKPFILDRKRWRCTAAMARRAGLPHALGKLAEKLGLEQQKDRSGAVLIRKFSLLQKDGSRILPKDDPEAFKKFCDYCVQDVRTEQAVHKKLAAFELKGFPLEVFQTDLEINARGLPVNLDAIGKAKAIVEDAAATTREAFKQLTGLEPTQGVAFLDWLKERGYEHEDLRADTIEEFLDSDECDLDGEVGQALSLRRLVSFAATKKLNSFEAFAGPHDNRVRGILMYYGAIRTGRWSSSGPQIQNAKKPPKHLEAHTDAIYRDICRGASVDEINFNYGNPIECVASCIRHFVQDDRPMLNADYSAIEARVLAWLAGEKWRLKLFTEGGDIYVASIAQMLGIKPEEVTKSLRQRGKVSELACIAEGQLVLTDQGEVPIEKVTTEMRVWDGKEFVKHQGLVYRGVKPVITYEGLTATEDHIVWTKEGTTTLGRAAECGSHLIQSAAGRSPIRLGDNHQSRAQIYQGVALAVCSSSVLRMQEGPMVFSWEPSKGPVKRMPAVHQAQADSDVAGSQVDCDEAAMRESKGQGVQELRSQRHPLRVRECDSSRSVGHRELGPTERTRAGSSQQRRSLRSREPSVCHPFGAEQEPTPFQVDDGTGPMVQREISVCRGQKRVILEARDDRTADRGQGDEARGNEERQMVQRAAEARLARVYDLIECGPNNRFTVSGKLVHNCGYGGGKNALIKMGALQMGVPEEELPELVAKWRAANPQIKALWSKCEFAAMQAVSRPGQRYGVNGKLEFFCARTAGLNYLFVRFPSGRHIAYPEPKIEPIKTSWGDVKDSITFYGQIPLKKTWARVSTYSGKFVENFSQGIAADVMAQGAVNCERHGYEINALIHDEALAYHREGQTPEEFSRLLTTVPDWAKGLPLAAPGGLVNYYRKD